METDKITDSEIESFLDAVVSQDVLGILGGHTSYDTLTEERLRFIIERALERNIEILSLEDVVEKVN